MLSSPFLWGSFYPRFSPPGNSPVSSIPLIPCLQIRKPSLCRWSVSLHFQSLAFHPDEPKRGGPQSWDLSNRTGNVWVHACLSFQVSVFPCRCPRRLQTWWPTVRHTPRKTHCWPQSRPQKTPFGRRSSSALSFKSLRGRWRPPGLQGHWCRVSSKVGAFLVCSI